MNIRDTKPGHIYGVSDRTKSKYWRPEEGNFFAVKALALEGQYEKANPNYWQSGNGKANGLTVEIQETLTRRDGTAMTVTLPGMADAIRVKKGNVVVISGRSIQWDEEGFRAVRQAQEEQAAQRAAKDAAREERRNSLKDRLYASGLGELDEYPSSAGLDWYPPDIRTLDDWERLLAVVEAREEVKA